MNIKQKAMVKIKETNFVGVNRLFALVYANQDVPSKGFIAKSYYLPKGIINNYIVISNGKTFMINQSIKIKNGIKELEN